MIYSYTYSYKNDESFPVVITTENYHRHIGFWTRHIKSFGEIIGPVNSLIIYDNAREMELRERRKRAKYYRSILNNITEAVDRHYRVIYNCVVHEFKLCVRDGKIRSDFH